MSARRAGGGRHRPARSLPRLAMLAAAAGAAALLLGGCGLLAPAGGGVTGASTTCTNMAGGACDEQAEVVLRRHPGATEVELTCTAQACNRAGGTGTAVVVLRDGTRVRDAFAYVGNPAPLPAPTCAGLEPALCREIAAHAADDLRPSQAVAAMDVRCLAAPCTRERGEVTIRITMPDGSTLEFGQGWEGVP